MLRLHSQLIEQPLHVQGDPHALAWVEDLILDPDRGDLVALELSQRQAVAPVDLLPWGDAGWAIKDEDAVSDEEDLVRLNRISPARRQILWKPVFTKEGDYLGKVADYVMDMDTLMLTHLYVTRSFMGWVMDQRVVSWKQVLEITDNAVLVDSNEAEERELLKSFLALKRKWVSASPLLRR